MAPGLEAVVHFAEKDCRSLVEGRETCRGVCAHHGHVGRVMAEAEAPRVETDVSRQVIVDEFPEHTPEILIVSRFIPWTIEVDPAGTVNQVAAQAGFPAVA